MLKSATEPLREKVLHRADQTDRDVFENALLLGEMTIKINAIIYTSFLAKYSPQRSRYVIRDTLLKASSVGGWSSIISRVVKELYRSDYALPLALSKSINDKGRIGDFPNQADISDFISQLSPIRQNFPKNIGGISSLIVFARNKIKHGAKGADFYLKYHDTMRRIVLSYLEFSEEVLLSLDTDYKVDQKQREKIFDDSGIAFDSTICVTHTGEEILVPILPVYLRENDDYYLPNSELKNGTYMEALNYRSGETKIIEINQKIIAPIFYSSSHTSSVPQLVLGNSALHNLPDLDHLYVERIELENELRESLLDKRRRPLITLKGRGGAGKTTLALEFSRKLVNGEIEESHFENVIWLSARTVDLLENGPKDVRRDVSDIESIARFVASTFDIDITAMDPVEILKSVLERNEDHVLLILDNFETLDNPEITHDVLESLVALPNKVLITSRTQRMERDFPIEVIGMNQEEAITLISREAKKRGVSGIISDKNAQRIYSASSGIPYLMKLAVNYISKGQTPSRVINEIGNNDDIRESLFRTSYDYLDSESKKIFLIISSFKTDLPTMCIAGLYGYSHTQYDRRLFYKWIKEIKALALAFEKEQEDLEYVSAPNDAKEFGKRELDNEDWKATISLCREKLINQYGRIVRSKNKDELGEAIFYYLSEEKDKADFLWLDQFTEAMCIYDEDMLKYWVSGRSNQTNFLTLSEVRSGFQKALILLEQFDDIRLSFAEHLLIAVKTEKGKSKISELLSEIRNQLLNIRSGELEDSDIWRYVKAANDYFQNDKRSEFPASVRRQLTRDIIIYLDQRHKHLDYLSVDKTLAYYFITENAGEINKAEDILKRSKKLHGTTIINKYMSQHINK